MTLRLVSGEKDPVKITAAINQLAQQVASGGGRTVIANASTYYVDPAAGSNTNDGLTTSSPWLDMTPLATNFDVQATVTLQFLSKTYTDKGFVAQPFVGNGSIILQGNTASPSSVTFNIATGIAGGNIFQIDVPGTWIVQGFKFTSSVSGVIGINCQGGGTQLKYNSCDFGSMAGGFHISAFKGGIVDNSGNYTISGGAAVHAIAQDFGDIHITTGTVTITGTPAFSTAFIYAHGKCLIGTNASVFSGSATGSRYKADLISLIDAAASSGSLPGDSAGSPTAGALSADGSYVN